MNNRMSDIAYRIKVCPDIGYNVGFHSLQSDIGGLNIRLCPISLIADILVKHRRMKKQRGYGTWWGVVVAKPGIVAAETSVCAG